ncbi:TrbG/VirB9 family P-type conjugative transfer protein [Sphingobium sufflavum]|uniref:TrbG/VirB9 family P-type conjugative transfer protein n=1 Tax=Sphingobium sufflavum TaxID=1129547 RepID=UPI001F2317E7|nr:TrbG/VirB9 family P-type conjugative transfer protein [Sphingobium sufflavum]MCE7798377.1 TrbG/VirB9 family P-type conjugative transfer protein [Sphingobium sufflavum]
MVPIFLTGTALAQPLPEAGIAPAVEGRYKLSGNRELMPSAIGDDGFKTYMQWSPEQPLPAVFSIDALGREEMVNGYMRGDVFTIDRVYDRLKFRIDKAQLTARRLPQRSGK